MSSIQSRPVSRDLHPGGDSSENGVQTSGYTPRTSQKVEFARISSYGEVDNTVRSTMNIPRKLDFSRSIAALGLAGLITALAASGSAAAVALPSSLTIDFNASGYTVAQGSPGTQNGWGAARAGADIALVDNASFPASGLPAGRSIRFSNATLPSSSAHLVSPLIAPAGESSTAAAANTFDVTFTVASATGAIQPGLGIDVNIDGASRYGGLVNLRHSATGLQVGSYWVPEDATSTGISSWRSAVFTTVPADQPHVIRVVSMFLDGQADRFDVFVDGTLVSGGTGATTWEFYTRLSGTVGDNSVDGISFKTSGSAPSADGIGYSSAPAAPTTNGLGFLFGNISYSTRVDSPPVRTAPPALDPAPSVTPDAPAEVPAEPVAPTSTMDFSADGFLPYEDVYATVYSTPVFAGWFQADANGSIRAQIVVPAGLAAGTHTLQLTGAASGLVAQSAFQVSAVEAAAALAATGGELQPLVFGGALAVLILGLAGVVIARQRRVVT